MFLQSNDISITKHHFITSVLSKIGKRNKKPIISIFTLHLMILYVCSLIDDMLEKDEICHICQTGRVMASLFMIRVSQ